MLSYKIGVLLGFLVIGINHVCYKYKNYKEEKKNIKEQNMLNKLHNQKFINDNELLKLIEKGNNINIIKKDISIGTTYLINQIYVEIDGKSYHVSNDSYRFYDIYYKIDSNKFELLSIEDDKINLIKIN